MTGLAEAKISVRHVVLHATEEELVRRIQADTVEVSARQWRLEHLPAYEAALPWLNQDAEIIDTTGLLPERVAALLSHQAPCVGGG
ncbi:MAG: hypothetical protein ACT4NP_11930 [Pseudonocardiales bacterium]